MYRIEVGKNVHGLVVFCVAAPDGSVLIPWRELGAGVAVDTSKMSAGPSDGIRYGKTLRAVHAASEARPWREEATDMGLEVCTYADGSHVHFREDGKVFAQWWPSTGSTMLDGMKGPKCKTGEDVIAWLKTV